MQTASDTTLCPSLSHSTAISSTTEKGNFAPGLLEVRVSSAEDLDQVLNEATELVIETAKRHHIGVMVTRIGTGQYIVHAHPAVPYGLTQQQHG